MSKLSDALTLTQTGKVVPTNHSVRVVSSWDDADRPHVGTCKEYTLSATFESRILLQERVGRAHEGATLEVVRTARRAIIQCVFGEFRDPLYRLAEQLNQHDITGARDTLEGVLEQMFT